MAQKITDRIDWDTNGFPGNYVYGDSLPMIDFYCDERWKRVKDFPDYWISDYGRLWSSISEDFICGTPNIRSGHIDVCLHHDGHRFHKYMHRMVAEAFIPNPYNLPLVRHLDDDPYNNMANNLVWGTQVDNMNDCISNGNFKYFTDKDREIAMQKRRTPIRAINIYTGEVIIFISQQEAARCLGLNQSDISNVLFNKRKQAKGWTFMYESGENIE